MEETKLTIRISRNLIENAKRYAAEHNTTLTKLIETFLSSIPTNPSLEDAPIVHTLSGTLPAGITIEDYKDHLEKKYSQ